MRQESCRLVNRIMGDDHFSGTFAELMTMLNTVIFGIPLGNL